MSEKQPERVVYFVRQAQRAGAATIESMRFLEPPEYELCANACQGTVLLLGQVCPVCRRMAR